MQRPDRVCVALYQNDVGALLEEYSFGTCKDLAGLNAVRARANFQIMLSIREFEFVKKDLVQRVRVMLTSVKEKVIDVSSLTFSDHWSHLDYLGAGAKDDAYLHRVLECYLELCIP